jgi:hypothetical protein
MTKAQSQKERVVAAKTPVATESEIEVSTSSTALEPQTSTVQIRGEDCSADFGAPLRLTLVAATSGLAEVIQPGQWALNNGLGAPVALGPQVEIVPLTATRSWLMDYGQEDSGGPPIRFASQEEVQNYGGTTTREPGKLTFSRAMELRLLLPDTEEADSTYLRVPINGQIHLAAVYEAARMAHRTVGVGLNLHWHNTKQMPHEHRWQLGVTTRKSKQVGAMYYLPTLRDLGPVSKTEIAELTKLIDRGLLD